MPADDRGTVLRTAAQVISDRTSGLVEGLADPVFAGLCMVIILGGVGALIRRTFSWRLPWPPISE